MQKKNSKRTLQQGKRPSNVILINRPPHGQGQWDKVPWRSLAISQPWGASSCGKRSNHSSTHAGRSAIRSHEPMIGPRRGTDLTAAQNWWVVGGHVEQSPALLPALMFKDVTGRSWHKIIKIVESLASISTKNISWSIAFHITQHGLSGCTALARIRYAFCTSSKVWGIADKPRMILQQRDMQTARGPNTTKFFPQPLRFQIGLFIKHPGIIASACRTWFGKAKWNHWIFWMVSNNIRLFILWTPRKTHFLCNIVALKPQTVQAT